MTRRHRQRAGGKEQEILINGEVNKPGESAGGSDQGVSALVNAGGFKDFANQKRSRLSTKQ